MTPTDTMGGRETNPEPHPRRHARHRPARLSMTPWPTPRSASSSAARSAPSRPFSTASPTSPPSSRRLACRGNIAKSRGAYKSQRPLPSDETGHTGTNI
jgi:hypothetical protein